MLHGSSNISLSSKNGRLISSRMSAVSNEDESSTASQIFFWRDRSDRCLGFDNLPCAFNYRSLEVEKRGLIKKLILIVYIHHPYDLDPSFDLLSRSTGILEQSSRSFTCFPFGRFHISTVSSLPRLPFADLDQPSFNPSDEPEPVILDNLGPTAWKYRGKTGRQAQTMPTESSA